MLRRVYASIMLEAGESVVTPARWLGHSSPAVTLGYYAHFMPEAGSEGRTAIGGLLGTGRACRPKLRRFCPGPSGEVFPDCTALELAVKCKAIELWGL